MLLCVIYTRYGCWVLGVATEEGGAPPLAYFNVVLRSLWVPGYSMQHGM